MKFLKDLGMRYTATSKRRYRYGLYSCPECNKEFEIQTANVGSLCKICNSKTVNKSHGMTDTLQYKVWSAMIQRTTNPKNKRYESYKDKTPPKEWMEFKGFWCDMGSSYKEGLTLDRIDNDKPYSKHNCRWTTVTVQVRNSKRIRSNNTSGYRGVYRNKRLSKWQAGIQVDKKNIHLGVYKDVIDAAKAYDKYVTDNCLEHTTNFKRSA